MEIFSFFQNLQLFSFGQNLTQGSQENQENQVTSPGVFESFMAEFKSQKGLEGQEEHGEQARQPEVLFAANDSPKVVRPEVRNLQPFRPVNISNETQDLPEKLRLRQRLLLLSLLFLLLLLLLHGRIFFLIRGVFRTFRFRLH